MNEPLENWSVSMNEPLEVEVREVKVRELTEREEFHMLGKLPPWYVENRQQRRAREKTKSVKQYLARMGRISG